MAYAIEGELYIDTVEFWGWMEKSYELIYDKAADEIEFIPSSLSFSNTDLYIEFNLRGKHGILEIDMIEFWEFVHEHVPCQGAETVFGKPRLDDHNLSINFAAGSDTDPYYWPEKPKCISEWS
jgi:hypothetical protein